LPLLWQTVSYGNSGFNFTAEEQILANTVGAAWGNFAWNNDPNKPGPTTPPMSPQWPDYTSSVDTVFHFDTPDGTTTNYRQAYCDFWDTVGYIPGNLLSFFPVPVLFLFLWTFLSTRLFGLISFFLLSFFSSGAISW
jgi:hypothetical protein